MDSAIIRVNPLMNKSELKPNSEDLCIHNSFQGRNCPKKDAQLQVNLTRSGLGNFTISQMVIRGFEGKDLLPPKG